MQTRLLVVSLFVFVGSVLFAGKPKIEKKQVSFANPLEKIELISSYKPEKSEKSKQSDRHRSKALRDKKVKKAARKIMNQPALVAMLIRKLEASGTDQSVEEYVEWFVQTEINKQSI